MTNERTRADQAASEVDGTGTIEVPSKRTDGMAAVVTIARGERG